jgi:hypothetical protein
MSDLLSLDIERPCIKCGHVDQVKNMVRLSGFDEEQRPGEEYEAWVHEIMCYREYSTTVMQLEMLDLGAFMEKCLKEGQP